MKAGPILLLAAGLGVGALVLVLTGRGSSARDLDRALETQARLVAARVEQNHLGELRFLGHPGDDVAFGVWRGDGTLVVRSAAVNSGDLAVAGAAPGTAAFRDSQWADGRSCRVVEFAFVPATAAGSAPPPSPLPATVVVAAERLADYRSWSILLALGSAVACAVAFRFATPRGNNPAAAAYQELGRRLNALDAGSLDESFETAEWPAEAAPTLTALNDLLLRLKKAFDRERGFSANLAHEIRTPLAELRTLAEVAFRWPEDDPEERARVFEEVYAIGLQMERIVDNLLAISRYETGHHALLTSAVGLADALRSAWRGVASEAEKRGIDVTVAVPSDLVVTTDREKLALVLTNLLSNAVAHGEPGTVECHGERQGDEFVLTLANPAQGLTAEDLGHMFERKWRKDRGDRGRHSGLGLALVATLCRRLGLQIAARLPSPGRIEITLRGVISDQSATVRRRAPAERH
ncbi:MAG: HAMP domain-containing sensor histidine kinase [Thermoanaerobaculia bacterium]|nr:HAMP domain-containing sensor histidine kinase [Thermoanaerobaculia bacterium]